MGMLPIDELGDSVVVKTLGGMVKADLVVE